MMSEVVVNWVVEARRPGNERWATMYNGHGDGEELAREEYGRYLDAQRANPGSVLQFRLVRRTAVVTDEVIESTVPAPGFGTGRNALASRSPGERGPRHHGGLWPPAVMPGGGHG
jgi:hypothetical protein